MSAHSETPHVWDEARLPAGNVGVTQPVPSFPPERAGTGWASRHMARRGRISQISSLLRDGMDPRDTSLVSCWEVAGCAGSPVLALTDPYLSERLGDRLRPLVVAGTPWNVKEPPWRPGSPPS